MEKGGREIKGSEGVRKRGRDGGREGEKDFTDWLYMTCTCKTIGVIFRFTQATTPAPSPLPLPTLLAQLWQATTALLCPSH